VTKVYVVRHAKAGNRRQWSRDDDLRPLSRAGRAQAEAIADLLSRKRIKRVVSSPYVRCRQTLDPLAQRLRLPLELSDALAEGAPFTDTLRLIEKLHGETAALCTHGDVLEALVEHLEKTGVKVKDKGLEKGAFWALDVREGEVVRAQYVPAPA
jgi:8-oxo-dGTP diphosphatase